jgi:hypothetical protein
LLSPWNFVRGVVNILPFRAGKGKSFAPGLERRCIAESSALCAITAKILQALGRCLPAKKYFLLGTKLQFLRASHILSNQALHITV